MDEQRILAAESWGELGERPHGHDRIREAAFESRKHVFSKEDKMNERWGTGRMITYCSRKKAKTFI